MLLDLHMFILTKIMDMLKPHMGIFLGIYGLVGWHAHRFIIFPVLVGIYDMGSISNEPSANKSLGIDMV